VPEMPSCRTYFNVILLLILWEPVNAAHPVVLTSQPAWAAALLIPEALSKLSQTGAVDVSCATC